MKKKFEVKALVMNMGTGEQTITKYIEAENVESVLTIFYKSFLTIGIISIIEQTETPKEKPNYNGWTNRETWLVNLHFSEILEYETNQTYLSDSKYTDMCVLGEQIKDFFEDMIIEPFEENASWFIKDYIDFSLINWIELVTNWVEV